MVAVIRVGAAVPIAQAGVREAVVVGAITSLDRRHRRDRKRHFGKYRGLEYALSAYERHSGAVEVEAVIQDRAGKRRVAEVSPQIAEEVERAQADRGVNVVRQRRHLSCAIRAVRNPEPKLGPPGGVLLALSRAVLATVLGLLADATAQFHVVTVT